MVPKLLNNNNYRPIEDKQEWEYPAAGNIHMYCQQFPETVEKVRNRVLQHAVEAKISSFPFFVSLDTLFDSKYL